MTKIMSASLVMFLLCNNQSQGIDQEGSRGLQQQIDQQQVLRAQEEDILFSCTGVNHSQHILGSKRLLCKGDANNIDINVWGFNNKIELRLEDFNSNNITLDLSGSIYPTVSMEIDKNSCANNVDIYSWSNVKQQNHGDANNISVHSPVYKHPIATMAIVVGLALVLGSKMCDK